MEKVMDGLRGRLLSADCPSREVLRHLTSRWGMLAMLALADGTARFSDLRRRVEGVSERMLAQTLKELEADGFVRRTAHPVVPPHVDYDLTPLGSEVLERMLALGGWIETNLPRIMAARAAAAGAA
jgi:DNA-binding HxlR family transcriptional regulator